MPERSNYAVVVWVRKTATFRAVRDELVAVAAAEPEESTEYEGMIDFHWRFDSYEAAKRLAHALRETAQKPEIVVLRLSSYDDHKASVTFKDDRHTKH